MKKVIRVALAIVYILVCASTFFSANFSFTHSDPFWGIGNLGMLIIYIVAPFILYFGIIPLFKWWWGNFKPTQYGKKFLGVKIVAIVIPILGAALLIQTRVIGCTENGFCDAPDSIFLAVFLGVLAIEALLVVLVRGSAHIRK